MWSKKNRLLIGFFWMLTSCGGGVPGLSFVYKLPDTGVGINQCYKAQSNDLLGCDLPEVVGLNKSQDGMIDPGDEGFSYGLEGGNDKTLCVRDQKTRLVWEGKTADGFRSGGNFYTNLGNSQLTDVGGYIAAVNSAKLCGYDDWRLPTANELQTIVNYGIYFPDLKINPIWFPNSGKYFYWASDCYLNSPRPGAMAWGVDFGSGSINFYARSSAGLVRLVRSSI
jgi:hypothetical protein